MKPAVPLPRERYGGLRDASRAATRADTLPILLGLVVLIGAVAVDRVGLRLTGYFNVRFELVAGGLVAAGALWRWRGAALPGLGAIEGCLLGWLAAGALASLLFAPNVLDSLKFAILLAGLLTLYAASRMLLRSARALTWGAVAWVAVGAGVTLLGLLDALLYMTTGWTSGISFNRLYENGVFSAVPMVHSTLWEANLFGSYTLTVAALAFALSRAPAFAPPARQWALRGALACACCGMILSMTRTVWAVGAVLLGLLALAGLRRGLLSLRQAGGAFVVPVTLGVLVGLGVGTAMPTVRWTTADPWAVNYEQVEQIAGQIIRGETPPPGITPVPRAGLPIAPPAPAATPVPPPATAGQTPAFIDRLTELLRLGGVPTWLIRQEVFANALDGWLRRPLLGWGLNSYQYVYPPAPRAGYWIGNLELHLLFDTGLVGFLLFGAAVTLAGVRGLRALRPPRAAWDTTHYILFGLLCGGLGLLLAYQLTEGLWLGFTWVFFALLVAAGRYATAPPGAALPTADGDAP